MTIDARHTVRDAIEKMTASWLWELANHIHNRIPDPVDYIEIMKTGPGGSPNAVDLMFVLVCAVGLSFGYVLFDAQPRVI